MEMGASHAGPLRDSGSEVYRSATGSRLDLRRPARSTLRPVNVCVVWRAVAACRWLAARGSWLVARGDAGAADRPRPVSRWLPAIGFANTGGWAAPTSQCPPPAVSNQSGCMNSQSLSLHTCCDLDMLFPPFSAR
ncbi:hypothetical protein M8818_000150 [Zalaria obscura]|uniref:Uncharacterized protein n=1 Tax=Zalaria obscura TaxID=2024903 RepID=A0ACC3SPQ8_9PEZI